MSGIKGLVILSRYDYIDNKFGKDTLDLFYQKLNAEDKDHFHQPVIISNEYPEILLKEIDELLLSDYFKNDVSKFYEVGQYNARTLLPRYFQIYIDSKNASQFLQQMSRVRDILIGLGEMTVVQMDAKTHLARINYGQPYIESVRLSEMAFLDEGCSMCGAKNVRISLEDKTDISVEYQIVWD